MGTDNVNFKYFSHWYHFIFYRSKAKFTVRLLALAGSS